MTTFRPNQHHPQVYGLKYCATCFQHLPPSHFAVRDTRAMCVKCWSLLSRNNKVRRFKTIPYEFDAEYMRIRASEVSCDVFDIQQKALNVDDCRYLCKKYKLSVQIWRLYPLDPLLPISLKNHVIILRKTQVFFFCVECVQSANVV
jgi:hypothetical protein